MNHSRPDIPSSIDESLRLARQLRVGDESSRWKLTQSLREQLKGLVRSQLRGRYSEKFDESDVVQAALVRAVRNICSFTGNTTVQFRAWLSQICRNETRNAIRHWQQQRRDATCEELFLDNATSSNGQDPNERLKRAEQVEALRQAIERLKPTQQALIQLRHFEDLSHHDIALKLGISVDAARQRWISTLRALKREMEMDHSD